MKTLVIMLSCLVGMSLGSLERNATFKICPRRRLGTVITSHSKVTSLVECGEKCMSDNTSNSANFIESSQTCELYESDVPQMQCDLLAPSESTIVIINEKKTIPDQLDSSESTTVKTSEKISISGQLDSSESTTVITSERTTISGQLDSSESTTVITSEKTTISGQLDSSESTTVITSEMTTIKSNNPCKNNQPFNGTSCVCSPPLCGEFCEQGGAKDCNDEHGPNFIDIYPDDGFGKIRVFCMQRKIVAYGAPQNGFILTYYNRTWQEYKYGFGDMDEVEEEAIGAYWLGNENIHRITNGTLSYMLATIFHHTSFQELNQYQDIKVDSETENYTIHYNSVDGVSENRISNGAPFSTMDRNDITCASTYGVGYWFDNVCSKKPPLLGSYVESGTTKTYDKFAAHLKRI